MGVTRYATATQKKWVGVECEICGTYYDCLVEAYAQASDEILPASDKELKEGALLNLEQALQKQAESCPCPKCGSFPSGHAGRVKKTAGSIIFWGSFLLITLLLIVLIAALAPKAPVWILLFVIIISLVTAFFINNSLVERFDPNRNLEENMKIVESRTKRGVLRLKKPELETESQER